MRIAQHVTLTVLIGVLAAPLAPARAAIFGDDEARKAILELRDNLAESDRQQRERLDALAKRIEALETRIAAIQHGQSETADQHDATMQEIAKLRGVTEQLANEITTTQKHEHDLYADIDQRLRKLEPASITVDGRSGQVDRDEQAAYDGAMSQFRARDFRNSVNSLSAFVGRFPQSVYAPAAQFWLGSSYYAIKDYPAAIAAQRSLVERFPESPRIPEALLNIAASQVELNDRKSARATLTRIVNDYPSSDAAKLARERLASFPPPQSKEKK
ncbi:MAG TPA: tol-pal system protein YbgF [Burkholderiaceae bacterium]|nr:tol-pal system protein YbgF [Burkholderiaceae bacterium]